MREYSKTKYKTDVVFQKKLREYSTKKYNTNDSFKSKLIEYSTKKYKTNEGFRQKVRKNLRLKYQDKDFQQRKKEYGKERYHKKPELKEKVMQSKKRRRNINASKCVDTNYVKLQRGRVMHVLHVIDFYLKIKWRNVINADGRFAKDIDYIIFSQYLSELKQVID